MNQQEGMRIFLVEDDPTIAKILQKELSSWNYEVYLATNFENIMEEFEEAAPHLVLLDIVLPHFNGYHWCQVIRRQSQVPIVFVSSKSENMDIVMAMQFGGDDYITKPIDLSVTVAKIQAILRRSYKFSAAVNQLRHGGFELNLSDSLVSYGEASIELTKTELKIMESLIRAQGSYVLRETILEQCWKGDDFIDDNTLAVNMTRLRKKLKEIGAEGMIATKKGVGYALKEPQHES